MVAHIHRDDLLVLNQKLQRDAVGQLDQHRVQCFKLAMKRVPAKRRM